MTIANQYSSQAVESHQFIPVDPKLRDVNEIQVRINELNEAIEYLHSNIHRLIDKTKAIRRDNTVAGPESCSTPVDVTCPLSADLYGCTQSIRSANVMLADINTTLCVG